MKPKTIKFKKDKDGNYEREKEALSEQDLKDKAKLIMSMTTDFLLDKIEAKVFAYNLNFINSTINP